MKKTFIVALFAISSLSLVAQTGSGSQGKSKNKGTSGQSSTGSGQSGTTGNSGTGGSGTGTGTNQVVAPAAAVPLAKVVQKMEVEAVDPAR